MYLAYNSLSTRTNNTAEAIISSMATVHLPPFPNLSCLTTPMDVCALCEHAIMEQCALWEHVSMEHAFQG